MSKEKNEFLLQCLMALSHTVGEMRKVIDNPEHVQGLALYGLGIVDAVCMFSDEFKEVRIRALDKEDNDVQAFVCAAKAFQDWLESNGLLPHSDFVSEAVTG